jgi:lipopolysaccharide export system protein LptA
MASIDGTKPDGHFLSYLRHIIVPLIFLIPFTSEAQDVKPPMRQKVEILNARDMEMDFRFGVSCQKLIGDVHLKHNSLYMTCDSAWYYNETNQVFAFSNIHIQQGDTIHIYGRYLTYNGDTGKAVMTDSVELEDKETRLFTDKIDYDVNTQVANYNTGGRILNGDNTLTSITGIYYSGLKLMHFRDSVKIVNPDYVMRADTMSYNTLSEVVFFEGPTEAIGDSIYIFCEKGWSDTKTDVSRLEKNAVLDNMKQRLGGDTLFYDKAKGFGEGFGHVTMADTANNVYSSGNYAWYYKEPERFMITRNATFSMISKDDTLTLRADTLRAIPQADTNGVYHRLLKAYYNCTIYSNEMQGVCDSLAYSFRDSVVRLYDDPVLWSTENQMTSDSMALFTKNKVPDRMELYNSAFVVSCVDSLRYNQLKGKNLVGYFRDNKLFKVVITGNGETIYFVLDGDKLVGVNKAKCASIEILMKEGQISEIYQKQSPDGTMEPPQKTSPTADRLDDFRWIPERRPKKMELNFETQKPRMKGGESKEMVQKPQIDREDAIEEIQKPKAEKEELIDDIAIPENERKDTLNYIPQSKTRRKDIKGNKLNTHKLKAE